MSKKRLLSLDAFRGLTIAVMILVNSPGNQVAYAWLQHSLWNGCTLADLVFPFFIVILGASSVLALANLKRKGFSQRELVKIIVKRSAYIFCMGLCLNILPNHFFLSQLRILGVLQRLALCYFFSAMFFLFTRTSVQVLIIAALLTGYWFLMTSFSPLSTLTISHNLVGYLDQWLLSPQHLYKPEFDPEGLLSTLPAIASALFGNLLGIILDTSRTKQQQLRWMVIFGLLLSLLGFMWSTSFPFNKLLWSSSYVLWSSGLSFLVFGACFALIEIKGWVYWSKPFVLLGQNAMLVYVLHILFLKLQAIVLVHNAKGELINLRLYISNLLFSPFSAKTASLCYALGYTLLWLFVLKGITYWRLRRGSLSPSLMK